MKPKFTDAQRYPFGYRRAVETDVRQTFRRVRAEQKAKAAQEASNLAEANTKTITLPRKRGAV